MTAFVGLDLAWGDRNASGVCVVDGDGARVDCWRGPLDDVVATLDGLGPDVVAGIDAPLIVGPGRWAEAQLARRMGRYGVYAHSSVAAVRNGYDRGIRLAEKLLAVGFSLDPARLSCQAPGRFAIEVYPHAGHVLLFQLDGILKYKAKKGRAAASLNEVLGTYRARLGGWARSNWPALLQGSSCAADLGRCEFMKGAARKAHEDRLDAITCAALAYVSWRDGLAPCEIIGDAITGYIAVPGLHRDPRFAGPPLSP